MGHQERWQLAGDAPERYELFKVPNVHVPVAKRLLERIFLSAGQRVLDVACGTGIVARLAAPRVAPAGKVIGLDMNEGMLAVARACAAASGLDIEWRQGDAGELPFAADSFDAVFCQQGLQFFPDGVAALREMRRVVVREGAVALSVNAASPYNAALAKALARFAGERVAASSLSPYSLGDRARLEAMLSRAGFDAMEIQTVVFPRRVEPTQEWLLEDSEGTPYAADVARLDPADRAAIVREIARDLARFWDVDCFSVPREVHLAYARKFL